MSRQSCGRKRGAVLIMVTFALLLMCGMLGLVVDLGWAYSVKKSAQTAADAAALAAVRAAKDNASSVADFNCGPKAECAASPRFCSEGFVGNLQGACEYAQMHGFTDTPAGRQRVSVQAWDRTAPPTVVEPCGQGGATVHHPPTAGCVDTYYWVTVRVVETIPQLFSAIYGNTEGIVSARATAGVAQSEVSGALILINRGTEAWSQLPGTNLYVSGTPQVTVPGGIILASTAHGPRIPQDPWAGFISGGGKVDAVTGATLFRGLGRYAISGGGEWLGKKVYEASADFDDPMRGKGQPPLTSTVLPMKGVPGGALTEAYCGGSCPSGNYYATGPDPTCPTCPPAATGEPITIGSNITFRDGAFGNFHFFGGLKVGQATVTFGPGRYGLFGVKDPVKTPLFDSENKAMLLSTSSSDAGRLFILSDTSYPGVQSQIGNIPAKRLWGGPLYNTLFFSKASFKAGDNEGSRLELYGLNKDLVPVTELMEFAPAIIWQDQRNSYVKYTNSGYVDQSCGGLDTPCAGAVTPPNPSPLLEILATPYAKLVGLIYQPRGAWTVIQAAGEYNGALRIISGAMELQGKGILTLAGNAPPVIRYSTFLLE